MLPGEPMWRAKSLLLLSLAAACGGGATSGGNGDVPTMTGACASTLADFCPSHASTQGAPPLRCDETMSEALADAVYCPMTAISVLPYTCCAEAPCAQGEAPTYELVSVSNVDVGYDYYYDATTQALVAVFVIESTGGHPCAAGPTDFVEPYCTLNRTRMSSCPGRAEAGAGDGGL